MTQTLFQLREKVSFTVPGDFSIRSIDTLIQGESETEFDVSLNDVTSGQLAALGPGVVIKGRLIREDALYHFTTRIVNIVQDSQVLLLRLRLPEQIEREQRRNHFRVDRRLECRLSICQSAVEGMDCRQEYPGMIMNISAGGVMVVLPVSDEHDLLVGSRLKLDFFLDEDVQVKDLYGEVLRVRTLGDSWGLAVVFVEPDTELQNRITRLNILHERRYLLGRVHHDDQ